MGRVDPHSYTDLSQGIITHLDWTITVDFGKTRLVGTATLTLENASEGFLDLDTRDLFIEAIVDGSGNALPWELNETESFMGERLRIKYSKGTQKIAITYSTSPQASALQWLAPQQTSGKVHPYMFSQCQPIHARAMLPIQDSPKVRFSYTAEVTIPKKLTAVMSAAPGIKKESNDKNVCTYSFSMPQPIPSYLLAIAVGDIVSKELGPRSCVYAEPELIEASAWEFAEVDAMLKAAEELFGPYKWERFDFIVMPPSFPYGGMENPRLTFLTPTLLAGDRSLVNVLAHELAHSWTGNLVTNATMNDFWLNEGFTVWAERRILERLSGKNAKALAAAIGFNGLLNDIERFGEDSPYTHLETDLSGTDPDEVYSVVPYEKGFLFVSLLEQTVGRERFDQFIRSYIDTFGFTSISTEEFESFLESTLPGVQQKINAKKWIQGPGIPKNSPTFKSDELTTTQALAKGWSQGSRPTKEDTDNWSAELWQIYLQGLPKKLDIDECEWLETTFDLSDTKNVEILSSWLTIAATSSYEPAFKRIDTFLGSMGRMKFLKPLYKALYNNKNTKDQARTIFTKHAESYHPIAKAGLEQLLELNA